MCSPCSPALSIQEAVLNENNNTSQVDRLSTKQIPSVVEINNQGPQRDLFSEQIAAEREESLQQKQNLQDSSCELTSGLEDLTLDRQECAQKVNEETELHFDGMVVKNEINVSEEARSSPGIANKDKVQESGDESLRDFALKLGYSASSINTGLSKLGASANVNSLLSELVRAESSAKQLEEGSSTFSGNEKPHPSPEDWTCLRPIVIDGSNVAMRYAKLFNLIALFYNSFTYLYVFIDTFLVFKKRASSFCRKHDTKFFISGEISAAKAKHHLTRNDSEL